MKDGPLKKRHEELFEIWKDKKLETVLNKYMLHAETRVEDIRTEVSVHELDVFVDDLEKYIKEIVDDLDKNHSGIGALTYETYLLDRAREVVVFFEEVRKIK